MRFTTMCFALLLILMLGCAGLTVTGSDGGGLSYDPDSYDQLEDNLDKLQDALLEVTTNPDKFFADHPQADGLSQSQVVSVIQDQIRKTMELKKQVSGGSGGGGGTPPSQGPQNPGVPTTPPPPPVAPPGGGGSGGGTGGSG